MVISGLVVGIDVVVYQVMLDVGGCIVVVIGIGFDCVYLDSYVWLQVCIVVEGVVFSEYLLGMVVCLGYFFVCNWLVVGLVLVIVVVEVVQCLGVLIIVWLVVEVGCEVCVLFGLVFNLCVVGCYCLICEGVVLVECFEEVLELFVFVFCQQLLGL